MTVKEVEEKEGAKEETVEGKEQLSNPQAQGEEVEESHDKAKGVGKAKKALKFHTKKLKKGTTGKAMIKVEETKADGEAEGHEGEEDKEAEPKSVISNDFLNMNLKNPSYLEGKPVEEKKEENM